MPGCSAWARLLGSVIFDQLWQLKTALTIHVLKKTKKKNNCLRKITWNVINYFALDRKRLLNQCTGLGLLSKNKQMTGETRAGRTHSIPWDVSTCALLISFPKNWAIRQNAQKKRLQYLHWLIIYAMYDVTGCFFFSMFQCKHLNATCNVTSKKKKGLCK